MKNKIRILITLIIIVIICFILIFLLLTMNNSIDHPHNVTITQYEQGKDIQLKKIDIDSNDDINELSKYVKELKPVNGIALILAQEIEIKYNSFISINIQLGQKSHCYYRDKGKNISSLAVMPDGLYKWVEQKIK